MYDSKGKKKQNAEWFVSYHLCKNKERWAMCTCLYLCGAGVSQAGNYDWQGRNWGAETLEKKGGRSLGFNFFSFRGNSTGIQRKVVESQLWDNWEQKVYWQVTSGDMPTEGRGTLAWREADLWWHRCWGLSLFFSPMVRSQVKVVFRHCRWLSQGNRTWHLISCRQPAISLGLPLGRLELPADDNSP